MNHELVFVYGLIALVVILIGIIVLIDRKESKKKPKNLFDTLNMKIINDATLSEVNDKKIDVVEIKQDLSNEEFLEFEPIKPVDLLENTNIKDLVEEPEMYTETDLEKTQAQIRVEEITNALNNAKIDEKIEEDKYKKFEEEQEKNAIISYNELKDSFDRIYSESEKVQYIEDDNIPINIDELYKLKEEQDEPQKVVLEDLSNMVNSPKVEEVHSTFKSSPLISPVYGIQQPPVVESKIDDTDIKNANQFLQNLRELQTNLEE